ARSILRPWAPRRAHTCRVLINVRARRGSVANFMQAACYLLSRVGTSSGSLFLRRLRGGMLGRDSWGPGSLRTGGRESGKAAVPRVARARRSLFPPRPRVVQALVTGGHSPSSDVPARLANGHNRLPNEARSE